MKGNLFYWAVLGLLAYLLYLYFTQSGAGALGGPGNAGISLGTGGASDPGCAAQICVGTPLGL